VSVAYVDTSALVAIAFDEPCGEATGDRRTPGRLFTAVVVEFLEAELRAAFALEQQEFEVDVLSRIDWILPDRPLASEMARAMEAGYLRGADLWHVATALYVAPKPAEIRFVTLECRQHEVASRLGFQAGAVPTSVDSGPYLDHVPPEWVAVNGSGSKDGDEVRGRHSGRGRRPRARWPRWGREPATRSGARATPTRSATW